MNNGFKTIFCQITKDFNKWKNWNYFQLGKSHSRKWLWESHITNKDIRKCLLEIYWKLFSYRIIYNFWRGRHQNAPRKSINNDISQTVSQKEKTSQKKKLSNDIDIVNNLCKWIQFKREKCIVKVYCKLSTPHTETLYWVIYQRNTLPMTE